MTCETCPFCQNPKNVVYWSANRSGTKRFMCKDCKKTFTKNPKSTKISEEKTKLIQKCLEERLSIEAIAHTTNSAKRTICNILKKSKLQLKKMN
jgi:transposase-like protein